MLVFDELQLFSQRGIQRFRQRDSAVFFPFPIAHEDLLAVKIDILDA